MFWSRSSCIEITRLASWIWGFNSIIVWEVLIDHLFNLCSLFPLLSWYTIIFTSMLLFLVESDSSCRVRSFFNSQFSIFIQLSHFSISLGPCSNNWFFLSCNVNLCWTELLLTSWKKFSYSHSLMHLVNSFLFSFLVQRLAPTGWLYSTPSHP